MAGLPVMVKVESARGPLHSAVSMGPAGDHSDSDDSDNDENPPLPMPHGGAPPAPEAEEENVMTHVDNPMWEELWDQIGSRPVEQARCFGCLFGQLNLPTLPYDGLTRLASELPDKMMHRGLFSAATWAGQFYKSQVLDVVVGTPGANVRPEVLVKMQWTGASIIWHYCKHTDTAQFREVVEEMELTYACDFIARKRLFVAPMHGHPRRDATIDPMAARSLAFMRQMLHRQRNVDPSKRLTFDRGLGVTSKVSHVPLAREQFTGRGLIHNIPSKK